MKRSTPKDWTRDIVRRFKDGETMADLAEAFQEPMMIIEGVLRRAMQQQKGRS